MSSSGKCIFQYFSNIVFTPNSASSWAPNPCFLDTGLGYVANYDFSTLIKLKSDQESKSQVLAREDRDLVPPVYHDLLMISKCSIVKTEHND